MQRAVSSRGISCVVHFTRLENVQNILSIGLRPRASLVAGTFISNDEMRLDRHLDATCLSISFPNYRMFYSLRMKDKNTQWAVLLIKPSILWTKKCAFFVENAASAQSRSQSVDDRCTSSAFLELFDEKQISKNNADGTSHIYSVRRNFDLPIFYPTNPQAEVLCFDDIGVSDIKAIFFQSETNKKSIKAVQNIKFIVDTRAFNPRVDYEAWR